MIINIIAQLTDVTKNIMVSTFTDSDAPSPSYDSINLGMKIYVEKKTVCIHCRLYSCEKCFHRSTS